MSKRSRRSILGTRRVRVLLGSIGFGFIFIAIGGVLRIGQDQQVQAALVATQHTYLVGQAIATLDEMERQPSPTSIYAQLTTTAEYLYAPLTPRSTSTEVQSTTTPTKQAQPSTTESVQVATQSRTPTEQASPSTSESVQMPTQTSLPTATPTRTPRPPVPTFTPTSQNALVTWKDWPVIPTVSDRAREIYQRGLLRGNNPRKLVVIGDCGSIPEQFLGYYENPRSYDLGPYGELQEVIDYFYGSFGREREAVHVGMTAPGLLVTLWTDTTMCQPNETPLQCTVRRNRPSIAFIGMGTNHGDLSIYDHERYLRTSIDYLIENGIVPIISTKADNLEGDHSINEMLVNMADELEIPLWNYYRAANDIPGGGLLSDGFHLTYTNFDFSNPAQLRTGYGVRNLTALQALDAVWRGLTADD